LFPKLFCTEFARGVHPLQKQPFRVAKSVEHVECERGARIRRRDFTAPPQELSGDLQAVVSRPVSATRPPGGRLSQILAKATLTRLRQAGEPLLTDRLGFA
jgi:hypothetical protein